MRSLFPRQLLFKLDDQDYDKIIQQPFKDQYIEFVVKSILILNSNNFRPKDSVERIIHTVAFFIGTMCNAIIFGNMAVLFQKFNPVERKKAKKIENINYYMESLQFPQKIRKEMRESHEIIWAKTSENFMKNDISKELNPNLRTRMNISMVKANFSQDRFLVKYASNGFVKEVCANLQSCSVFMNDVVTFEDNLDGSFYMVPTNCSFKVKVNGNIVNYLKEGDYFGEIATFLNSKRRTATVER